MNHHCMKSFLGHNDLRIKGYGKDYSDIELKEGFQYYYFCTVFEGRKLESNVHIAFREKTGSSITIDDENVKCEIVNAERIPIDSSHIDQTLPQARETLFYTCRNWMFANMINGTFVQPKSLFDV